MNTKKKCKQCKEYEFSNVILVTNFGNFCGNECRIKWAQLNTEKLIQRAKKERKRQEKEKRVETKLKLEKLDSISVLEGRLQKNIVNPYIRLRDKLEPCISCGTSDSDCWQAGHYRSIGSFRHLRFEELNIHKQCKKCNFYGGDEVGINYRTNLIQKIGLDKVLWLEGYHEELKRTREDLEIIKEEYKEKMRVLKAE